VEQVVGEAEAVEVGEEDLVEEVLGEAVEDGASKKPIPAHYSMDCDKEKDGGGPLVRLMCNMVYRDGTSRNSLGLSEMKYEKYKQAIGRQGPFAMPRKKPPP
jgi:hypothetical protein